MTDEAPTNEKGTTPTKPIKSPRSPRKSWKSSARWPANAINISIWRRVPARSSRTTRSGSQRDRELERKYASAPSLELLPLLDNLDRAV